MNERTTFKHAAPEWVLFWTFLGTPVVGAIPATLNFIRFDKKRHIWWVWVTAVLWYMVAFVGAVLAGYLSNPHGASNAPDPGLLTMLVIFWIWGLVIYFIQGSMIPRVNQVRKSILPVCLTVLVGCVTAGWSVRTLILQYQKVVTKNTIQTLAQVGTNVDKSRSTLDVSGTGMYSGQQLYARLQNQEPFGTQKLTLLVSEQDGQGWTVVDSSAVVVNPDSNIVVDPFQVDSPGNYSITFVSGNKDIASTNFKVYDPKVLAMESPYWWQVSGNSSTSLSVFDMGGGSSIEYPKGWIKSSPSGEMNYSEWQFTNPKDKNQKEVITAAYSISMGVDSHGHSDLKQGAQQPHIVLNHGWSIGFISVDPTQDPYADSSVTSVFHKNGTGGGDIQVNVYLPKSERTLAKEILQSLRLSNS